MKKSNKILAVVLALVMMLTAVPMMTAGAAEEEKHEHVYVQQGEATKATCTEDGKATFKCECGDIVVRVVEEAPGHKPTTYESVNGNEHKTTCETCKEVVVSNHNWNDGKVTKEATCEVDGVKTFTCTNAGCDDEYTEAIPAIGHKMDDGTVVKAASCGKEGTRVYKCKKVRKRRYE